MAKRGRGQTKTGRSKYPPFVRLEHHVLDHPAYRALDAYAVQALVCLCRQYKGAKGCRIMASVRWIANTTGQSHERAWKSLATLEHTGFIVPLEVGHMGVEGHGTGTIWRLTFLPAEGVGETHDYRAKWETENLEPRYAPHNKRRYARRNKGISGKAESVTPDVTRNGEKQTVPVMPDVTTSKILPYGTPLDGWLADDWHVARAVSQRRPWTKPRLTAFDLPNLSHPEPEPRTFAVLAVPGVVQRDVTRARDGRHEPPQRRAGGRGAG